MPSLFGGIPLMLVLTYVGANGGFSRRFFKNDNEKSNSYDFIVVGGGSAGSVIASRLSEIPQWRVLLLEAGKVENFLTELPLLVSTLEFTDYDWQYLVEYDPNFGWGMVNHQISYPRGKGLGGSSLINYMAYTRGHPSDYDLWAQLGNPGWSYEEVLPYFKKSENSTLRHFNPDFHGTTGYLNVGDAYQPPLVDIFAQAGAELGYEKNLDYNTDYLYGFGPLQYTIKDGRRHSVARAFLEPAEFRPNLKIMTDTLVTKILIESTTLKVYGVEYVHNNKKCRVFSKKEVIVSGGSINTPQLLMLSGIGPRYHLKELGIETLIDLPVGEYLQDHPVYFGLNFIPKSKSLSMNFFKILDPVLLYEYYETGSGPFSSPGGIVGVAFLKSNTTRPNIELELLDGSMSVDFGLVVRRTFRVRDDVYKAYWKPNTHKKPFSIFVALLHPKSRGHVKLRSPNPTVPPLIYPRYFSDPHNEDIREMIQGIRFTVGLQHTKSFREHGITLDDTAVPGCDRYLYNTDGYWECAIRTLTYPNYHPIGTAKMGPKEDPTSVVDYKLRVHGIWGLRVADASVIPVTLSGHTNAPCVMIGEKASDLIKSYWKPQLHK